MTRGPKLARALALSCALVGACGPIGESIPRDCMQAGDRCHLREGLLGVCSETTDDTCDEPPCLRCTPQH